MATAVQSGSVVKGSETAAQASRSSAVGNILSQAQSARAVIQDFVPLAWHDGSWKRGGAGKGDIVIILSHRAAECPYCPRQR
jgi:hypothetical protein